MRLSPPTVPASADKSLLDKNRLVWVVARWVLVFPAALGAYIAVGWIAIGMNWLNSSRFSNDTWGYLIVGIIFQSWLQGTAFVLSAYHIAPSGKTYVAVISATSVVIICGYTLAPTIMQSRWQLILAAVATIVSAIYAAISCCKGDQRAVGAR